MSASAKLTAELADIDVQLEKIDSELKVLRRKKQALLERKVQVSQQISIK